MEEAPQPQPLQPVPYKPKYWHPLLFGGILIIAVLTGGFIFLYYKNSSTPTSQTSGVNSGDSKYYFTSQYKTDSHDFLCRYDSSYMGESSCVLFARDSSGNLKDLGSVVDTPDKALLLSPGGKYLLVVKENEGILLNTTNLEKRVVIETPTGEDLGTWTGFPFFVPHARWLDNSRIEFVLYPHFTLDESEPHFYYDTKLQKTVELPAASPLDTRIVNITSQ